MVFDPEMIVPDISKSLNGGAIAPWANSSSQYYKQTLESIARHFDVSMTTKWSDLPDNVRKVILHGSGGKTIPLEYDDGLRSYKTNKAFEGIVPNMTRRYRETDSSWVRDELGKYQNAMLCESCKGQRLKPEALAVKIDGETISTVTDLAIGQATGWFSALNDKLGAKEQEIAYRILKEINERLGFLASVGLDYLTLSRKSGTLSGGESQRIRLASQIGSGLTGVLYVLDEPSIGLHQRDNDRLLATLRRLRDLGNTVIVVEHDEDAIRSADHVVDMGPGAGTHGGHMVASGPPAAIMSNPNSLTGQYLTGMRQIPVPDTRRKAKRGKQLKLFGARANNLKNVDLVLPMGILTCITGVSGGVNSSLVVETLY